MKLKPEQLKKSFSQGLLPVYLIAGDVPLIVQECAQLVREQAKAQGFTDREVLNVESGFDWGVVVANANSMSLFGDDYFDKGMMAGMRLKF